MNEFSDSECRHMRRGNKGSLENCKASCLEEPGCTAFNYWSSTTDCVLRACNLPVVPPSQNVFPHYGYWLLPSTTGSPTFLTPLDHFHLHPTSGQAPDLILSLCPKLSKFTCLTLLFQNVLPDGLS